MKYTHARAAALPALPQAHGRWHLDPLDKTTMRYLPIPPPCPIQLLPHPPSSSHSLIPPPSPSPSLALPVPPAARSPSGTAPSPAWCPPRSPSGARSRCMPAPPSARPACAVASQRRRRVSACQRVRRGGREGLCVWGRAGWALGEGRRLRMALKRKEAFPEPVPSLNLTRVFLLHQVDLHGNLHFPAGRTQPPHCASRRQSDKIQIEVERASERGRAGE